MRLLSDIVLVEYQGFEQVSLSVLDADEAGPSTAASLKEVAGLLRAGGTRVTVEDLSEGSSWGRASWWVNAPDFCFSDLQGHRDAAQWSLRRDSFACRQRFFCLHTYNSPEKTPSSTWQCKPARYRRFPFFFSIDWASVV